MKPLLMDGRALNQCHSLDHSKGDFKKVSSKENKLALYEDIQLIRPDLYATTGYTYWKDEGIIPFKIPILVSHCSIIPLFHDS